MGGGIIMNVSWEIFKAFVEERDLSIQWIDLGESYTLKAFDNYFTLDCSVNKDTDECTDFETNFQADGNKRLSQFDTDGASITRAKAAKSGWSFWACPPEITTSTLSGTLYCKDVSGTDIPGVSCKIYDNSDAEITTAGLLGVNLTTCVKTVLDIEHPFDTELIGGSLRINSNPASDLRLWIVGAPDIPAIYGGSKEFASGINLKFLAPDNAFDIDGVVTKYITYNNTNHSGKIRLTFKHAAGLTVNLQVVMRLYRL